MGARETDPAEDSSPAGQSVQHEITLRVVRRPLPGHEASFEQALAETLEAVSHARGYLGARTLLPPKGATAS